jgi:hypothetical protein
MDPTTNDSEPSEPKNEQLSPTDTPPDQPPALTPPSDVTPPNQPTVSPDAASEPAVVGSAVVGGDSSAPTASPPQSLSVPAAKGRSYKKFLVALVAVLIIGGGSAAAYLGVILPNKPINVLKQALSNSLQQPQSSFKGTLVTNPASSGGVAYKADFSGATDSAAKAADFNLSLTVSGVAFPIEARLVNQNVYVKPGDLSTIAGLANAYSPGIGGLAKTLSSQLSNKWIVIDSTLLNQSGAAGCILNTSWAISKADTQLLNDVYGKNSFVTIQSTSADSVNGQNAKKFVLSIDDDKLAAYGNDKTLDNLSLVKSAQKCDKNTTKSISNAKGDHGKTPLTVWVGSNKRIAKIAYQGTSAKKGNLGGSLTLTFDYNKVSITAPSNAEPAIQVLTDIQKAAAADPALLNLLGGGSSTATQ